MHESFVICRVLAVELDDNGHRTTGRVGSETNYDSIRGRFTFVNKLASFLKKFVHCIKVLM